jgi:hypothetical protein
MKREDGVRKRSLAEVLSYTELWVHNGAGRGLNDFSQMNGVLVVCTLVAIHICSLLRDHLIDMQGQILTGRLGTP